MEILPAITHVLFTAFQGFLTAPLAAFIGLILSFFFQGRYNIFRLQFAAVAFLQTLGLNGFFEGIIWFIEPYTLPAGTVEGGPVWGVFGVIFFIAPLFFGDKNKDGTEFPLLARVFITLTAITLVTIRYIYFR